MSTTRKIALTGFLFALGSSASFSMSGIFASALISSGWSAGAAVTIRITLAGLVLLTPTLLMLRGRWGQVRRAWLPILLFGLLAVVVPQLFFFLAVQYIPPSIALLIEFLGPVLIVFYLWARTRIAPSWLTLIGAAIALVGLVAVSGLAGGAGLHPLGVFFALLAAVGVAAFFMLASRLDHGIDPIPFTGLSLLVAAAGLWAVTLLGLLPFTVSTEHTVLGGFEVPMWLTVLLLVLVSTVLPYVLGVMGSRRLGATVASFTGYSEPLFGIIWTILLLSIVPNGMQWVGAVLIILGVVTVRLGEMKPRPASGQAATEASAATSDAASSAVTSPSR